MNAAVRRLPKIRPHNTSFFLCDIQDRFRPIIFQCEHVISTASKMVDASKILKIPLVVTEQNPKALGRTVPELDVSQALPNGVIPKMRFSMWTEEVSGWVKKNRQRAENVVLFGIESHVCVLQTALDLIDNHINVVVLVDGVSSQNRGEIQIALERLRHSGATLATSESILFQLMEDANHENFKQISSLVKSYRDKTSSVFENLVLPGSKM